MHAADVSSLHRCLLHCMRLLNLDIHSARRRAWDEKEALRRFKFRKRRRRHQVVVIMMSRRWSGRAQ